MRNIPSLAYVLSLVCLASWQCGRSTPNERRDAATEQAAVERTDGGPDAPGDRGPDGSDTPPDSRTVPDGGGDPRSSDGTIDRGAPDGKADAADGHADVQSAVEAGASEVEREVGGLDGSGQCNDLTAAGPLHDVVGVDQPAPVPLGGAIEDGLYYETAAQVFGSGGSSNIIVVGDQRRMAMRIEGPILQAAFTTSADGETHWETDRMTVAPATDPTAFGITQLCPGSSGASDFVFHYSFVGTGPGATFTIIYPPDLTELGETIVLTLTKQ